MKMLRNSNKARAMARKYALARHHAWGGLGLISLFSAIRLLFPPLPDMFFFPTLVLLILYVLFWLAMTYRFRSGLATEPAPPPKSDLEVAAEVEKARLKAEKKKAKALSKARLKAEKKKARREEGENPP